MNVSAIRALVRELDEVCGTKGAGDRCNELETRLSAELLLPWRSKNGEKMWRKSTGGMTESYDDAVESYRTYTTDQAASKLRISWSWLKELSLKEGLGVMKQKRERLLYESDLEYIRSRIGHPGPGRPRGS